MRPYDIIVKKRDGKAHTYQEIESLVSGYTKGEIADYQVSAWLMAGFLNGLNREETYYLTKSMLQSGKTISLDSIDKPKIDKHSTGGVGDKISLILAPAVSACGVAVPMISGRGLGFSGGTLDKLGAIPGYGVNLTETEFVTILKNVGFVMSGQTKDIAPADRKLYALRDVTGTVENIPFITSSILSKKFAEGADSIVMDVKFGSGAFMKTKQEAKRLAQSLVAVARRMERRVVCVLTSMDQPLGRAVGNSLEVIEAVQCMQGHDYKDVLEVTSVLGGHMLLLGDLVKTAQEGEQRVLEVIHNGEAFKKFLQSVEYQGGAKEAVMDVKKLPKARHVCDVPSLKTGFIHAINTESIGTAALFLGAGRFSMDDRIDPAAGIVVEKKTGDHIDKGEKLVSFHYNNEKHLDKALELVRGAYVIKEKRGAEFRLIHEVIG